MTTPTYKSKCCNAPAEETGSGDFYDLDAVCTTFYVCTKCKNHCAPVGWKAPKNIVGKADSIAHLEGARKYQEIITRGMNGEGYTVEDRKFIKAVNKK